MARYKENNNFIPKPQKQGSKPQKTPLKERLNKILFWVIVGLFCLFSVGSICGILAYSKDCNTAYADEVQQYYSFDGSNISFASRIFYRQYVEDGAYMQGQVDSSGRIIDTFDTPVLLDPLYYLTTTGNSGIQNMCNFRFSLHDTLVNNTLSTEMVFTLTYSTVSLNPLTGVQNFLSTDNATVSYREQDSTSKYFAYDRFYLPSQGYVFLGLGKDIDVNVIRSVIRIYKSDPYFNCNIKRIELGNSESATFMNSATRVDGFYYYQYISTKYNYIRYYDQNERYVEFAIPFSGGSPGAFRQYGYTSRTYYLSPDFSQFDGYDQGYQDGYTNGEQVGQENGYQNGYQKGNKDGYQIGYNEGKNYGYEHASDYSFYNLIAAVVDAPLNAVISLFNFEILGINFSSLFTGLLTLAVIIFVVRLVL